MATLRKPRLRSGLLEPTKPPTKKPTKKPAIKAPTKRPTTKRVAGPKVSSAKQRADAAIEAIREAFTNAGAEYYTIGKALIGLRKPAIWKLYAADNFDDFLDDNVMPHSTAHRMITIAESYPQTLALTIGLERSYQLARLARIDPDIDDPPAQLWRENVELGDKRVQAMSAADLERLTKAALLRKRLQSTKAPTTSPDDKSAVSQFKKDWKTTFGDLEAEIRFNPRKRTVRIEFHVDELFEEE